MALPDSDLEKSRDSILLLGMCGASEVSSPEIIHCSSILLALNDSVGVDYLCQHHGDRGQWPE